MRRYRLFFISVFLVLVFPNFSQAQQLIAEIDIGKSPVSKRINGTTVGDSIFLTVHDPYNPIQYAFWIYPDGQQKQVDIHALRNKIICGITERGKKIYFFDQSRKEFVLKCMVIDSLTGKGTILPGEVIIPGKLLGSYIEKGNLFLICSVEKSYDLAILGIRDSRIIKEMKFAMTYDLLRNREYSKAFILAGTYVKPQQAEAQVKIFKYPHEIFISIDEIPDERIGPEEEPKGTMYKSTVTRLDLVTGKATTRSYFESERHTFTTFVSHAKVYRLVNRVDLTVMDFSSNEVIRKIKFSKENFPSNLLHRDGEKNTLETEYESSMVGGSFLIVDSLSMDRGTITIGDHYKPIKRVPWVPVVPAATIVSLLGTVLINEVGTGLYHTSYTYLNEAGTVADDGGPRKRIDDFEISNVKYSYKGYLQSHNTIYAIYREKGSHILKIFRF